MSTHLVPYPHGVATQFEDRVSGENIYLGSLVGGRDRRQIMFGGDAHGAIVGGIRDDRLYGGAGGEAISGGVGNGHLEGGGGADRLDGGPGNDTLIDLDREKGDRLDGGRGFDTYTAEFGDTVADTPEMSAGAVYVYVGADRVQLTGGRRTEGQAFYTSEDGRFKYWADSRGAIKVFKAGVSAGDTALTIEAPSGPVPGLTESGTESVRGRPDLGIALTETKDPHPRGSPASIAGVKTLFDLARTFRPASDPLALDLAGNGFQTVGNLGTGTVLFDHDAVGVRNGTGWLTGDDGLIGLDRDGDGLIATGRELFGDRTVLPDGSLGADGFTAIAPLDTNGDFRIDANDPALAAWQVAADVDGDELIAPGETRGASYADLLLWTDENVNGISEPFELASLQASGIASISLAKTLANQPLPGENTLRYRGTYTRGDGSSGTAGALDLARESFYREYAVAPSYAPGVESLPQVDGTGRVRDLQEAAGESAELRALVEAAQAATGRAAQSALIERIVQQWAARSSMLSGLAESASLVNAPALVYSLPGIASRTVAAAYTATTGGAAIDPAALPEGWYEAQQSQAYRDTVGMIGVLERFTGQTLVDVRNAWTYLAFTQTVPPEALGKPARTVNVYGASASLREENLRFLKEAYALLQDSVAGSVAVQTRLLPYVDAALAGAPVREFSVAEALLAQKRLADPAGALADLVDLGKYAGTDLVAMGWTHLPLLIDEWLHEARADPGLAATLADLRVTYRDTWMESGGATSDVLIGTHWEPPFSSGAVRQSIGGFGDDLIFSDADFEVLFGGSGSDILYGGPESEIIAPGLDRDIILFGRGSGVDQVDSWMDGDIRASVSTFAFPILPATDRDAVYMLPGVAPEDVRVRYAAAPHYAYFGPFSAGLTEGVALSIRGTDDVLYDAGFSTNGTTRNNFRSIEEVHFADGTVWDLGTLRLKQVEGTEFDDRAGAEGVLRGFDDTENFINGRGGNDRIEGYTRDDTLLGDDGNDELLGYLGNDLLLGGEGDDVLEGFFGADTLDGGTGNDQLYGGVGVDTYVLAANSGSDRLVNSNAFTYSGLDAALDVVVAASDVSPDMVRLQRRGNGLHLFVDGTETELWDAGNGGANDPNPDYLGESGVAPSIGRIEFANGTVWSSPEIKSRSLLGAGEGDDEFYGFAAPDTIEGLGGDDVIRGLGGDDILSGGAGDDRLEGGAGADELWGGEGDDRLDADDGLGGDDRLDGGAGNDLLHGYGGNDLLLGGAGDDTLYGDTGTDTAVFSPGDGQDLAHGVEVLRFGGSLVPASIDVWRDFNDLVFEVAATGERLRAVGGRQGLTRVEFSDGSVWDQNALAALRARATEGGDVLEGDESDDTLAALGGNDTLYGFEGDDLLDGGAGVDTMYGGAGNDVYLVDQASDRAIEQAGEGVDTVQASASVSLTANVEHLVLTGAAFSGAGNELDNVIAGTAGGNSLLGGGGADTLRGGGGADTLSGGPGADLYLYSAGDGADSINDTSSGGEQNVLRLESIVQADVTVEGIGGDLSSVTLLFSSAGDRISLASGNSAALAVDRIEFADGSVWHQEDVAGLLPLAPPPPPPPLVVVVGTQGDDVLIGDGQPNLLVGLGGNDILNGFGGNDILVGAGGGDVLNGGPGNDLYGFVRGDGHDVVQDFEPTPGNVDTLVLGEGIVPQDVSPSRSGQGNIVLRIGTEDSVTLAWNRATGAIIERVVFSDGELWDDAQLEALADGGSKSGPVVASALAGQTATEDKPFAFAVPLDTFSDPDAGDTLVLRADLASGDPLPAWLEFAPAAGAFAGTPGNADVGVLRVRVAALDAAGASAAAEFALTVANVNDAPIAGAALVARSMQAGAALSFALPADAFVDPDAGDALALSAGLAGGAPLPAWLRFSATAGEFAASPVADGDIGLWRIEVRATDAEGATASSGFDLTVTAPAGGSATGNAGDDLIAGGTGNETLAGRQGDDFVAGLAGDDFPRGGRGDDLIRAGRGSDVILFNRGNGNDVLFADRGADSTLSLGGIGLRQLPPARLGRDLVLELGAGESITFRNWYGGRTSLANLQIVTDIATNYEPDSVDALVNRRVASFDVPGLVSTFDAARAAQPGLSSWALTNALADFHLSASDNAALGAAQDVLRSSELGRQAQQLRPLSGLQEGLATLVA